MASRLKPDHKVVVVGAGAHAHSVMGVIADIGCVVLGLVADGVPTGTTVGNSTVLGGVADVFSLSESFPGVKWVIAIGDNFHRLQILRNIQADCRDAEFPPVVHESCLVASNAKLGEGAVLMPGTVLMAGCRLGAGCLVNTRASLDHECELQEGASVAPGVIAGGRVTIGRRSFVGIGSTIIQGICIGDDTVIGAGSLVLRDVPGGVLAYGRPSSIVRRRRANEPYF